MRYHAAVYSTTQDRQHTVAELLDEHPLDLAVVIGDYNSSNTRNLARICADRIPTYHIADPTCLVSAAELRHRPLSATAGDGQVTARDWLPPRSPVAVAVTAGASTPDSIVGAVIEKLVAFAANRWSTAWLVTETLTKRLAFSEASTTTVAGRDSHPLRNSASSRRTGIMRVGADRHASTAYFG